VRLSEEQQEFTTDIACLIQFANSIGVELTFGEAYRTNSQVLLNYFGFKVVRDGNSLLLVKRKRTSWTLRSKHPNRLAVDFNFFINGNLYYKHPLINQIGRYWCDLNSLNEWGGNWLDRNGKQKDTPHFQRNRTRI